MTRALVKTQIRVKKALEAKQERGATAVEYGLMVALIAVVLIAGVGVFGKALNDFFNGLGGKLGLGGGTTPTGGSTN